MEYDTADMHAATHGSGQSVNVNLGNGFQLIIGLILALLVCVGISVYALTEVSTMKGRVAELSTEARLMSYWAQRTELSCSNVGVKVDHFDSHANSK